MKKIFYTSLFLFITSGLFAQTTNLSPYHLKTTNTERFERPVNTGINHTLLILESAWETSPELGDELAIYDSEKNLVASVAWRPEQNGHTGLVVWGDDETTSEKDGMINGEIFNILLFDKSEDLMTNLQVNEWARGGNTFYKDGISVVNSISTSTPVSQELELFQNTPNPVMDNTHISFYLPEDGMVRLTISNTLGQEVMNLTSAEYAQGLHTIQMDAKSLSTGSYFYKLEANKTSITKQLTRIN